jgi:ubiquinone/menaquinone biosynthesis C-methylase UbiE
MFSIPHLNTLRKAEIDRIVTFFEPNACILEIGAGTGEQALELKRRGFDVTAVEIADSNYASNRQFPIIDYDGKHIPLPDASVDVVFSSNVLEHVPDLSQMHAEIRRVLKPSGYCIHVLPTHSWRLWTTLSSFPDAVVYFLATLPQLLPHALPGRSELRRLASAWYRSARYIAGRLLQRRHGERGNVISELWLFRPEWWRRNFRENGFSVVRDEPMKLFYTGNMLLGPHLSLGHRERIASVLGSACHLFKIVPARRKLKH